MLSTTDLLTLQSMPRENDLSLQTIQSFYKEHLCDRLFIFHLDDDTRKQIKLRFDEKDLCHLLGIHYIVKGMRNKYDYAGRKGYKLLEDGTVTFDFLKQTNKKWFKSIKKRMLYFPFVYQIIHGPSIIEFTAPNDTSRLELDLIIYSYSDNTYLHLGLDKDIDSDFYYPKSFFDRKKSDYIDGRTSINVVSVEEISDLERAIL